jgi:hypothetical protein
MNILTEHELKVDVINFVTYIAMIKVSKIFLDQTVPPWYISGFI